ncbi:cobalt-precorrin-6A reductase [Tropicimonas aquimaris]|uniref:Cobalt-precorrin-6A reductase n=1 Tax=Tropicimonas aquimaris TaxID=914152 RepID=A0ABW3IKC2_9RHOB
MRVRVMILGGTAEARQLAEVLHGRGVATLTSLAGVTRQPASLPGDVRRGGFGGVGGLAAALAEERITALVDATHPFAQGITANAVRAAKVARCPLLVLRRPAWERTDGADWSHFADLSAAMAALPAGARALLATGSGSAQALDLRPDLALFLRSIEPVEALPAHVTQILARPPFSYEEEVELLRAQRITHLVTRNAGGTEGGAKLDVAAALGLRVMVIDRPPLPEGVTRVGTVGEALGWLARRGVLDTPSGPAA